MNAEILPVLDEISAVLKKHDMTGIVIVGNRSHCDWRMEIEATWSCAFIEKDATGQHLLRIRSKRAQYPSREAQHAALETTTGTFVTMSDVIDRVNENLKAVLVMLAKHITFVGKSTTEE